MTYRNTNAGRRAADDPRREALEDLWDWVDIQHRLCAERPNLTADQAFRRVRAKIDRMLREDA